MLRLLLILVCLSGANGLFAQNGKYLEAKESPLSKRLKVDFEINNQTIISDSLLRLIDYKTMELHRQKTERNLYTDTATGLTIIVYSKKETSRNKLSLLETKESSISTHN